MVPSPTASGRKREREEDVDAAAMGATNGNDGIGSASKRLKEEHSAAAAAAAEAPAANGNGVKPEVAEEFDEDEEAARVARIAARAEAKATARAAAAAAAGGGNGNGAAAAAAGGIKAALQTGSKLAPLPTLVPGGGGAANGGNGEKKKAGAPEVVFLTKKQREQLALQKLQEKRAGGGGKDGGSSGGGIKSERDRERSASSYSRAGGRSRSRSRERPRDRERERRDREPSSSSMRPPPERESRQELSRAEREREKELQALKDHYLGKKETKKRVIKPSEKFARIFQFDWEPTEDTSKDSNPLYAQRLEVTPLFGRGYVAGVDMREQRKHNRYLEALTLRRQEEERRMEEEAGIGRGERRDKEEERQALVEGLRRRREAEMRGMEKESIGLVGKHWRDKRLEDMTERDWRIFREDFNISMMRGTRMPNPLRNWEEAQLPEALTAAIAELGWKEPSPIQRAAVPVGLERRDIIGIAETGSGKTGAFSIPLINYCLTLAPEHRRGTTADDGPLALVMAPTRELAEQIETQVALLIKGTGLKSTTAVGGKSIDDQSFALRQGVDILIGTPGRLQDLLERRLLVLNQCNYIVLDEADRMVDMGFEEQLLFVLNSMGSALKSEDDDEAAAQATAAKRGDTLYRVTAMFSATMPPAVERIARTFLRSPATIKIGDQDSGKNKRIDQHVLFTTEPNKKNMLLDLLRRREPHEKFIVFVNAKRQCDVVARTLEQGHVPCGILHGGKSQDQREASLDAFRQGDFQVLVATDVAARGLDIPDVSHVVNHDMPNKIENYCHRIGRTGRAGKEGLAITYLTEGDAEVMYDLKAYLESTDMKVPPELARHPAAQQAPGTRNESGQLVGQRKDATIFSKR